MKLLTALSQSLPPLDRWQPKIQLPQAGMASLLLPAEVAVGDHTKRAKGEMTERQDRGGLGPWSCLLWLART